MSFKSKFPPMRGLLLLFVLTVPCFAQREAKGEVSLAALSLPPGADGILHLRIGEEATVPVQLSTRYFSERLAVPPGTIRFYPQAMPAVPSGEAPPEPLLSLRIPEGPKLLYIVLWTELGEDRKHHWKAKLISATDWKAGSMKLINSSPGTLGLSVGKKEIKLPSGKTLDFQSRDWREPFPVKIYQPGEPGEQARLIFSSTWRVSAGRRELCLIGNIDGTVSLRSLIDLNAEPSAKER